MKKLKTLAVAMLTVFALSGQISPGDIILMGGGGVSNASQTFSNGQGNDQTSKNTYSYLDFGAMYMLTSAIGVGLALQASNNAFFLNGDKEGSENLFGAMIMARYYSACMAPRFYAFGQVDFAFAGGAAKSFDEDGNEIEEDRDNLSQLSIGLRPGIAYFLTPAIMLEASFGALAWQQTVRTNNQNNDLKITNNQFEFFAYSKLLQFGFCWWLGRHGQRFE